MTDAESQALVRLEDYAATDRFNVLTPVISLEEGGVSASPYLVESVQVVQIKQEDCYNDFRYANANKGEYALGARGLAKLAAAAGISWVPDLCRVMQRDRRQDGHVYIRYQAAGWVRQPNGEPHLETAEKEIDTADVEERLTDQYERQLARSKNPKFSAEEIPSMVKRDLLALKEHLVSHAETKAKNRVIRRILTLKQVYNKDQLMKPFAVPRLLYRADMTTPMGLEQVLAHGQQASTELFGSPARALGAGQQVEVGQAHEQDSAAPVGPDAGWPAEGGGEGSPAHPTAEESVAESPDGPSPDPSPETAGDAAGEVPPGEKTEAPAATKAEQGAVAPAAPAEPVGEEEGQPEGFAPPEPSPPASPAPERERPKVEDPEEDGVPFSRLALEQPDVLERISKEGSPAKRRALATAWLNWANNPQLC